MLALPTYRKWCAAENARAARSAKVPNEGLTLQPMFESANRFARVADYHFAARAVQYAAWLANRDGMTIHDANRYQGRYLGKGKVELYFHETPDLAGDCVTVAIPNWDWEPGKAIAAPVKMIEAPAAAASPARIMALPVIVLEPVAPKRLPRATGAPERYSRDWYRPGPNGLSPQVLEAMAAIRAAKHLRLPGTMSAA